jgi:hypothetical protein
LEESKLRQPQPLLGFDSAEQSEECFDRHVLGFGEGLSMNGNLLCELQRSTVRSFAKAQDGL